MRKNSERPFSIGKLARYFNRSRWRAGFPLVSVVSKPVSTSQDEPSTSNHLSFNVRCTMVEINVVMTPIDTEKLHDLLHDLS